MSKYDKLVKKAKELYETGDLENASKYYEQAFVNKVKVSDYLMLGYIYIDLGYLSKAENIFNKVHEISDGFEVNYGLANIYERSGRKETAIEYYNKVLKEKENFEMAHFSIAYLYDENSEETKEDYTGENVRKAVHHYQRCLECNDNNFWAHINLGSIFERFNYNNEALEHFQKAYNIDKDEKMVCYNLGVAYYKLKEYDLSLKYYLDELKKEEPFGSTWYNLGILYKDGFNDYNKAKYYYLLGLEKNNEDYNIWYNLGCIHALLLDYENAFECFKYIYYKNKKYLGYLDEDKELEEFRKTEYYLKLKEGL